MIDNLVRQAVFGSGKKAACQKIRNLAGGKGIRLVSINDFYLARATGELGLDFTVPAINIRGLTYDIGQVIFSLAKELKAGVFILEIARSEISYTDQSPEEYAAVILAAALKAGFSGPVFIQGDHYQFKNSSNQEVEEIKKLVRESIEAGFYNIDIDASTLVDYQQKTISDQQKLNFKLTAELAGYIRSIQPEGITVSIGGEIGHIGGKNSTEEELEVFMKGFKENYDPGLVGLSKISVQTGTHHGGVVLPNGKLANVAVDFEVLKKLGNLARKYGMGGAVQHGASTLPKKYFSMFPQSETLEIHLATEFQNLIFDHQAFPSDLLRRIYQWLDNDLVDKKEKNQTLEQFHYKTRKKAWGKFKKEIWELPEKVKKPIMETLEEKFSKIFRQLNVVNTRKLVKKYNRKPTRFLLSQE